MLEAIWKRLKSKTYWLGFATLALGILEAAQATNTLPDLLEGRTKALATLAISVMIFLLREMTTAPVASK